MLRGVLTFRTDQRGCGPGSVPDEARSASTLGVRVGWEREVEGQVWSRFKGGKAGKLWYYRAVVTAFRTTAMTDGLRRLVDELDRVVTELERLAAGP